MLIFNACSAMKSVETEMVDAVWSARKPMVVDGKVIDWEAAPEFLHWRHAVPAIDGFSGEVLKINLTGPFAKGAWSQHAGALFSLGLNIPKGQAFVVSFKARSLKGPKNLTVLRSWGGAKPWKSITITDKWKSYQVVLTPEHSTDTVCFSLVPKTGGLQPYCAGTFELNDVKCELFFNENEKK